MAGTSPAAIPAPPEPDGVEAQIRNRHKDGEYAYMGNIDVEDYRAAYDDIAALFAALDAERRRVAETAVAQEAIIHLMSRYLNDEDWITLNKIRATPGWETHILDFDIATGEIPDSGALSGTAEG